MVIWILILSGVLLNSMAQILLKAAMQKIGPFDFSFQILVSLLPQLLANYYLWLGFVCYGISIMVWLLVLSRVEVSFAYPLVSIGYIINAIAAYCLLNETLSLTRIAGIGVIMFGVLLISRS